MLFKLEICHPKTFSESGVWLPMRQACTHRYSAGVSQSSHTFFLPAHFASVIQSLLISIGCEQFLPARVIFYFLLVCSRNPGESSRHSPERAHNHTNRGLSPTSSSWIRGHCASQIHSHTSAKNSAWLFVLLIYTDQLEPQRRWKEFWHVL